MAAEKKKIKKREMSSAGGDGKKLALTRSQSRPEISDEDIVDQGFKVRRKFHTDFKREALDQGMTSKELLEAMFNEWMRRKK